MKSQSHLLVLKARYVNYCGGKKKESQSHLLVLKVIGYVQGTRSVIGGLNRTCWY